MQAVNDATKKELLELSIPLFLIRRVNRAWIQQVGSARTQV